MTGEELRQLIKGAGMSLTDIPKDVISLALGHSDGSKVTSVYIHTDMAVVDDANRKVIDYILG